MCVVVCMCGCVYVVICVCVFVYVCMCMGIRMRVFFVGGCWVVLVSVATYWCARVC